MKHIDKVNLLKKLNRSEFNGFCFGSYNSISHRDRLCDNSTEKEYMKHKDYMNSLKGCRICWIVCGRPPRWGKKINYNER